MNSARMWTLTLTIGSLVLPHACVTAGTKASLPSAVTPPRIASAPKMPKLASDGRVPFVVSPARASDPPRAREVVYVSYQVEVDETGHPDMSTFTVTGPGADANIQLLTTWMKEVRFAPATRDGTAVRGTFKATLLRP
jgi:hypothetical protein